MSKFAILIEPWAVYMKDWDFFVDQGGLQDPWGKRWQPIEASSIEDAREKGAKIRNEIKT